MSLGCDLDTGVIDWIAEYPETLIVLETHGIDYCCGGKSLGFACREQRLDTATVLAALREAIQRRQHLGTTIAAPTA
jgi:iron-sulfur cluster repair protein YtfE (RIC family)